MTIKQLHHYICKYGGYSADIDFKDIIQQDNQLLIIDACAVLMFLLQSEKYVCRLMQSKLCEKCMLLAFLLPWLL